MTRPKSAWVSPSSGDPHDLLQGVVRQDPEAIDAWFRAQHPAVYRLCLGFLAHAAEAEDVAQDAMLSLLDKLPSWDPTRSYEAWRDTLVLNRCRDRIRRLEARGRALERALEERAEVHNASAPDAQRVLEQEEVQRVMTDCLSELTPREREVFVLRDLEGRTSAQAADLLSITPSSVRSLLTLARRRLRGILGQRLPGLVPPAGTRAPGGQHE